MQAKYIEKWGQNVRNSNSDNSSSSSQQQSAKKNKPHNIHTAGEMNKRDRKKGKGEKKVYNIHLLKYATKSIHIINVTLSHAHIFFLQCKCACLGRAMKR